MHLCAQEDKHKVAVVLDNYHADINPETKVKIELNILYKYYIMEMYVHFRLLGWIYSIARCLSFWSVKYGSIYNRSSRS